MAVVRLRAGSRRGRAKGARGQHVACRSATGVGRREALAAPGRALSALDRTLARGPPSGRRLAHLEAIPVWIGDDGNTHAIANRFDWTGHDLALSEAGQECVEVVDQECVQRRTGATRVGYNVYPARFGQSPCRLVVVRDEIRRPANESFIPACGRVAVGDGDASEDVSDGHREIIAGRSRHPVTRASMGPSKPARTYKLSNAEATERADPSGHVARGPGSRPWSDRHVRR